MNYFIKLNSILFIIEKQTELRNKLRGNNNPANAPERIQNRNNQNLQANHRRPPGRRLPKEDPFADLYQDQPAQGRPQQNVNRRNRNGRLGNRRFPFLLGYGGYGYGGLGYGYGGYGGLGGFGGYGGFGGGLGGFLG